MTTARSVLAIARQEVVIDELLAALEHTIDVERFAWRPPVSSMLGERLLRPTHGDGVVRAGRVVVRGLARVVARTLAARAWVRGADRAPRLRDIADQMALFTSPDQVELAMEVNRPRFYLAIDDFTSSAWSPRRVIEAERRLAESCERVFAVSAALAETLVDRHGLKEVVVIRGPTWGARASAMLDAMRGAA